VSEKEIKETDLILNLVSPLNKKLVGEPAVIVSRERELELEL
jgi:hypothetical protein